MLMPSSTDRSSLPSSAGVAAGELYRVRSGIAEPLPEAAWPPLFRRETGRILAALFPSTVVAYRSAFDAMDATTIYPTGGSYARVVELPGLKVALSSGLGPVDGNTRIEGRDFFFPSTARMLLQAIAPAPREDDPQHSRKISAEELEGA